MVSIFSVGAEKSAKIEEIKTPASQKVRYE